MIQARYTRKNSPKISKTQIIVGEWDQDEVNQLYPLYS